MYKAAYAKNSFSKNNIAGRQKYGQIWSRKTVEDTFQWWLFTDKAHFDPSAQRAEDILQERGTRLAPENIQMRRKKTGVVLHVAG